MIMAEQASQSEPLPGGIPADFKMPSMDELQKMIDSLEMSDEEKQQLRDSLKEGATSAGKGAAAAAAAGGSVNLEMVVLLVMVSLLLSALFFFGYKLFKSLRDRETKREEKRRQKQLRKKK